MLLRASSVRWEEEAEGERRISGLPSGVFIVISLLPLILPLLLLLLLLLRGSDHVKGAPCWGHEGDIGCKWRCPVLLSSLGKKGSDGALVVTVESALVYPG